MWLRRAYYGWLFPAAFILPLWLLLGWGLFDAGGWALLWVLLIAMPSVFVGQIVLTLLVRARAGARATRAVSWIDVAGFTVWHCLTIALGFYNEAWFVSVLVLAIVVGLALFWLQIWQLWQGARASFTALQVSAASYLPTTTEDSRSDRDVFILTEKRPHRTG